MVQRNAKKDENEKKRRTELSDWLQPYLNAWKSAIFVSIQEQAEFCLCIPRPVGSMMLNNHSFLIVQIDQAVKIWSPYRTWPFRVFLKYLKASRGLLLVVIWIPIDCQQFLTKLQFWKRWARVSSCCLMHISWVYESRIIFFLLNEYLICPSIITRKNILCFSRQQECQSHL